MPLDPTPISDYAHWNEDAQFMWYQEVGRFGGSEDPPDPDDYDDDGREYYDDDE